MTITSDAALIFADAHAMYTAALDRLAADDVRDAAEKAWCAAKRATDALIVARTGVEPERSTETGSRLRELARTERAARRLRAGYYERQGTLHGECFYVGLCEPRLDTEQLIRDTIDYIRDAERLADI